MLKNEQFPLTESLDTRANDLSKLVTSGRDYGMRYLATQRLREPITHEGQNHHFIRIGRLLCLDASGGAGDDLLHFSPMMSIHIYPDDKQQTGLITDINYAQFGLSSPYFDKCSTPGIPVGRFLLLESFEVAIGNSVDSDQEILIPNGTFNSADEYGEVARVAAQSIVAAADIAQSYSIDELSNLYV
jgi:hypothetical protein